MGKGEVESMKLLETAQIEAKQTHSITFDAPEIPEGSEPCFFFKARIQSDTVSPPP